MPMKMEKPKVFVEDRRNHGWETPWDYFQMSSWVIFSFLMLSFYLVVLPLFEDHISRIWIGVVYGILLGGVIIATIISSATDPVDTTIWKLLQATPRDYASGDLLYCCFCKCKVHKRSKHCRVCNKCVGDFDHHCKWLNNCVGGANYRVFFFLICVAAALMAWHGGWNVKILMDAWNDDQFPSNVSSAAWFASVDRNGLLAVLFVSCIVSGVVFVLLMHLVGFHLYLMYNRLSTYDYILLQRAQAVEKQQKQANKRNKVAAELQETSVAMGDLSSRPTASEGTDVSEAWVASKEMTAPSTARSNILSQASDGEKRTPSGDSRGGGAQGHGSRAGDTLAEMAGGGTPMEETGCCEAPRRQSVGEGGKKSSPPQAAPSRRDSSS